MTAKQIFELALAKLRRLYKARRLAALERDLDMLRAQRDEIHNAESYCQREAMFLRADLLKVDANLKERHV